MVSWYPFWWKHIRETTEEKSEVKLQTEAFLFYLRDVELIHL